MMHPAQKRQLAAAILGKGKALAPDRFPQASPEVAQAWAEALGRDFDALPFPRLWDEAVILWATRLVGDRMITPRELRDASRVIRDRWDGDPRLRQVLNEQRQRAVEERDHALANGTFLQLKGYNQMYDGRALESGRETGGLGPAFGGELGW